MFNKEMKDKKYHNDPYRAVNFKTDENGKKYREIDKLREEMKQKLGKFEQSRLISQDFYESMQLDYKKGIKLDEIIKAKREEEYFKQNKKGQ